MPHPRPILKRFGASSDDSDSPNSREGGISRFSTNPNKVHFPNHPDALARTHIAHSPDDYDRSPIKIRPNICALPERGCPGRTYSDDGPQDDMDVDVGKPSSRPDPLRLRQADRRHPFARVVGFLKNDDTDGASTHPPLVYDISDMSEDSDNSYMSLDNASYRSSSQTQHFSSPVSSLSPSSPSRSPRLSPKGDPAQLAFLPHPHSYSHLDERSPPSFYSPGASTRDSRPVRRSPSSPTRQGQRSRSRVRGSPVRDRHGPRNKQEAYGSQEDEGCLGGF